MSVMKPPFGSSTDLSQARDRLAGVAFEAIWERDLDNDALSWDENLESIFGYRRDEVASHLGWWRERVHPDDLARVEQTAADAIRGDVPGWSNEYRFRRKDGSWAWVASRCVIERDAEGRARRAVGAMIDISKLKEAESQLRQVLDTLPVGVAVVDRAGDVVLHNPASSRIWGRLIVPGQERYAKSEGFWHGSGKAIGPEEWASRRAIAEGEISRDELIDINTFDGQRRTIENYAAPMRDGAGNITGAVVVNDDVTDQVRAEEALRKTERLLVEAETLGQTGSWEQDLISRAIVNTEANRRLFFGDDASKGARLEDYVDVIHPDDRAWVTERRGQLLAGTGSVDGAIRGMRERAQDLRPPMLDELGLEASLRWYVEREAKRAGLASRLALAPLAQRPPAAVETTCFRVAQEALTNVIRHAQAHVVDVELSAASGTLQLVVHDDGRGFDVSAARKRAAHGGSQGLLSMQERVALAGGDLEIDSAPGRGTTVRARLPLTAGSDT